MHIQIIIDEVINGWILTIIPKTGAIKKEFFEQYLAVLSTIQMWNLQEMGLERQLMNTKFMDTI